MKLYRQVSNRVRKLSNVLSVLWPIAGLIYSIFNFRAPNAKNIFFIFCVFFGIIFIYYPDGGSTADGRFYAESLEKMYSSTESFNEIWKNLYAGEPILIDVYQPLITFLISRFTGNPHFLFLCFAIVFGYFYSRNLWYIFERI